MLCTQCGREIDARYAHCPYCGAETRHREKPVSRAYVFFVTAVIVVLLFTAVIVYFHFSERAASALVAVQTHAYRSSSIGDIFSALDECRWQVGRDNHVSVSGVLPHDGYSTDIKVDFTVEGDDGVDIRALFVNGKLQPVSSISSVIDRLYMLHRV